MNRLSQRLVTSQRSFIWLREKNLEGVARGQQNSTVKRWCQREMRRTLFARDGLSNAKGAQRIQQRHRWTARLEERVAESWNEDSFYCQILMEVRSRQVEVNSLNDSFTRPLEPQILRKRNLNHHPCCVLSLALFPIQGHKPLHYL